MNRTWNALTIIGAIAAGTLNAGTASQASTGRPAARAAKPAAAARRAQAPAAIHISNFTFKNKVITVKPGTTVSWTNDDDIPHNIVAKNNMFRSKVLDTGDTFSFTFTKPGQFLYFCGLHPQMTGTIIVKA